MARAHRIAFSIALVIALLGAAIYLFRVPRDPPGFYLDESSIAYNAHTISQAGTDEYGNSRPLFFRAFGEYKNPTLVYLLAVVYRVARPSIAAARLLAAVLGWSTGLLLGWLAWRIAKNVFVAALVAISAWLTPWLFESSRVVLEVVIYPGMLALFLLLVWAASRHERWRWTNVGAIAITLALVTYSYSIGRLLAPLLALGAVFFWRRTRWRAIAQTWLLYAILLLPLLIFHFRHPDALTNRFNDLTYWKSSESLPTNLSEFGFHFFANLNPWHWLVTGEDNIRDHVAGTGALLFATVLLGIVGLILVWRKHRRDPWWQFVVYGLFISVVPASLTGNEFPQLRLIAFPVFFTVLTIPALQWFSSLQPTLAYSSLATLSGLLVLQGFYFQYLYHRNAPSLWYVFDARFPRKVLAPTRAAGPGPIYLVDPPGRSGYIHALWYGVLEGIPSDRFVRVSSGNPPAGSLVISTEEECSDCILIARSLNYISYAVPPYSSLKLEMHRPLSEFHASIVAEDRPARLSAGERVTVRLLIKNISQSDWPAIGNQDGSYAVALHAWWRPADSTAVVEADLTKRLPYDIEPGDTVGLSCELVAPETPGDYRLEFDLAQRGVGEFREHGGNPEILEVRVAPAGK